MARLLSQPVGLGVTGVEPLSGPRAVHAGTSSSVGNFLQTTASPFGLWRFRFTFRVMMGKAFRSYRGWVTAMHAGANATRWDFFDPDMMSPHELGLNVPPGIGWTDQAGEPWGNGEPWVNGQNWGLTPPTVPLAAAAAFDASIIELQDVFWGHRLECGSYLGFFPFYLGLHIVTEVIAPGRYRIWPPLRKALTADDFATLRPTLAMRLESEDSASASRGLAVADGLSVTMVETLDYDVRDYFAD